MMFVCKKCKSKRIKTRTNNPFGKKSRPLSSAVCCKSCGSTSIGNEEFRWRRGSRR